jgi:hypothetical protein
MTGRRKRPGQEAKKTEKRLAAAKKTAWRLDENGSWR